MMKPKRKARGVPLMVAGIAMLLAAAALVASNSLEERQAGEYSAAVIQELRAQMPETAIVAAPRDEPEETAVALDGTRYLGLLTIPALELELPIRSDWSDAALRRSPCRYTGTAGEENLVIAGHNYRSHFGALFQLPPGSEVILETTDGRLLRYQVAEKEILAADAVEEMTAGESPLTLFTCTYGGRSRLTLRCGWAA